MKDLNWCLKLCLKQTEHNPINEAVAGWLAPGWNKLKQDILTSIKLDIVVNKIE